MTRRRVPGALTVPGTGQIGNGPPAWHVISSMPSPLPTPASPSRGWPESLVRAYDERWLELVRLAYVLTGDEAVAEELVQDVFVAARPRWEAIANPGGYLRTSVVNATRDWGRHQQVVQRHEPRGGAALRLASPGTPTRAPGT